MQPSQTGKAVTFRSQHTAGKLLILPNIWDVVGARLIEQMGFPSVATASVATALANGYADGEKIPFTELLKIVRNIAGAVSIPLTVDIERGFAVGIPELKENILSLIQNGAVGINIEDSLPDGSGLCSTDEQCRKIETVRETGIQAGVPMVINARTDSYLLKKDAKMLETSVSRAISYKNAGADCVYPIMMNTYSDIEFFVAAVQMPVNLNLQKPISDLKRLETIGVARLSVGPQLMNHALTAIKVVAEGLRQYDSSVFFKTELLPRAFLDGLTKA